ncbi:MAG: filamentous hemagglutinin N-terminal domain-containing protein [Cyanobacteriota bacterium]|nr:filamentous hemagglutinin N-terminal domain-containing protein [Cyanobacteriota bacterium]
MYVDHHLFLWSLSVTLSLLPIFEAKAQLTPDNTLGKENSLVNSVDSLLEKIEGGAIRGSNLFHSFKEFNINNGKSVYFQNPNNIKNILTRITGNNSSRIFGTLGVNGNANLFLINPNGIIFGENAKLDMGGSFIGSTANSLKLSDGTEFNAINPSNNSILTINIPLGLQYGANPGNIEVKQGESAPELQVANSKSLALIGGNIKIDGAKLTAPSGRIDLFAVQNGEVSLVNNNGQIKPELPESIEYRDIEILNQSNIDASGNNGGTIKFRGKNITIQDSSQVTTNTLGNGSGETLDITATELFKINYSGLFADVEEEATGTGSDLILNSKRLLITDRSFISSSTYGLGDTGNFKVNAEDIQITDRSFLYALVGREARGNGGDLTVEANNLQLSGGSQIAAATSGKGTAGNMEIKANTIKLVGFDQSSDTPIKSGLFASAVRQDGQGGNLNVTANQLIISDEATINASNFFSNDPENLQGTAGTGAAGNININSPFILLENQSIITANANAGDKGNINIQSQNLQLRQQSVISTNAKNSADGGNIDIETNTLLGLENSDITANSEGSFGGRVIINANGILGTQFRQELTSQSDITATSSLGASFSGVVDINTISVDPNSGLVELPETFTDSTQKITSRCAASAGNNFVMRGRGGNPVNPNDLFNGSAAITQLFDLIPAQDIVLNYHYRNIDKSVNRRNNQIIEATGWVVDGDGNTELVAEVPQDSQQYPGFNSVSCKKLVRERG